MTNATHDLDTDEATQEGEGLAITIDQFDITKHDAVVTVLSPYSGEHRTFKIATVRDGDLAGKRIVSLLTGQDNVNSYTGFAFVDIKGTVKTWQRLCGNNGKPSQWEKLADLLSTPNYWESRGYQFALSLRCRRCGRPLTAWESLSTGYGPVCVTKV